MRDIELIIVMNNKLIYLFYLLLFIMGIIMVFKENTWEAER